MVWESGRGKDIERTVKDDLKLYNVQNTKLLVFTMAMAKDYHTPAPHHRPGLKNHEIHRE